LVNALAYHVPLYLFGIDNLDMPSANALWTLLTLFVFVFCLTAAIAGALAAISVRTIKPLFMVMAIANAIALYFSVTYGVVLDKTMMGNVFNTDVAEALALFHPMALVYVAILGIFPCWLLHRTKIRPVCALGRVVVPLFVCLCAVGWLYAVSPTWLWIDRHAKQLGALVMPWSYLINGGRYLGAGMAPPERRLLPPAEASGSGGKPKLVVLVIGESARAQNFSLYGYARKTNPELEKAGVTVLQPTYACATYTTAAIECILSPDKSYNATEPMTSYLQRNGVDVIWRSHNGGEPPMQVSDLQRLEQIPGNCSGDECGFDEGLLRDLEQRIADTKQKQVLVVLHLAGSHGPAYNTRYPARFEVFKPVCKSVQLHQCSREELVNAYDNSILYSDFVVAQSIDMLKRLKSYSSSLIYVSDHGESLGEYKLYLHGTPWTIAPEEQKAIPLIVWNSETSASGGARHISGDFSQANVFHSVMGALGMRSPVFKPDLNVFAQEGDRQ
jgi:Predicted membrane-associated, metal-dependent hydrolase